MPAQQRNTPLNLYNLTLQSFITMNHVTELYRFTALHDYGGTALHNYNNKQGRCNEGFNAEPIAFAFCISNLNIPPKIRNFSDFGSGKIFGISGNFMIGRHFWVWVKNLCSGENFGFGRKGLGGSPY